MSLQDSLSKPMHRTLEKSCSSLILWVDGEGSDSESSSESVSDDWDQIASDMRTDVECLIDLEPLIKCPFIDSRKANSNQTQTTETTQWTPLKLYSDRIANRFPVAQAELVERLARANWDRFQRIQLEKERNIVNRDDERVAQEADLTTPTETGSAFQDSGLGTSLRTGSRYAETVMSYKQDNGHSIKIPQLPPEAKNGTPFCCLACGRRVRIRGDTMWKKHLFSDLKPWVCHYASCNHGTIPFETRKDWVQHLAWEHGLTAKHQSIECPLCLGSERRTDVGILSHFADHLEEISLSSLPTGVASEQEDDSDSPSNVRKLIRRNPEERAKQAPPDDLPITQNDRMPVEERGLWNPT
ncbi:Ankyrin repeat protein [Colletotrichum asianum]